MKCLTYLLLLSAMNVALADSAMVMLPFDNATGKSRYDALAAGMPDLLTTCLSEFSGLVNVVERQAFAAAAEEQSLDLSRYTQGGGAAVGHVIAADWVLRGSVTGLSEALEMQLLVFDARTAILSTSLRLRLDETNLVGDLCTNATPRLVQRLQELTSESQALVLATDVEKQNLMINGLNHFYNGKFAHATGAFLDFTQRYADSSLGVYWLARSLLRADLSHLAHIELSDYLIRFPSGPELEQVRSLLEHMPVAQP